MDREESDGSIFRDRAFANVYICDFEEPIESFNFDTAEVKGLVKMNAKDVLSIINDEVESINATYILRDDSENKSYEKIVTKANFLVNPGENAATKYGDVVKKVIEVTKKA